MVLRRYICREKEKSIMLEFVPRCPPFSLEDKEVVDKEVVAPSVD